MKKVLCVLLSFVLLVSLCGCGEKNVVDEVITVSVQENGQSAQYYGKFSGVLAKKLPSGNGSFSALNSDGTVEWTYEGDFEEGTILGNGTIEDKNVQVTLPDGTTETGKYTGPVAGFKPNGNGKIECDGWSYEGDFENGAIIGNGTVSGKKLQAAYSDEEAVEGTYTGTVAAFKPDGEGKFESEEWSFEGTFAEGKTVSGNITDKEMTLTLQRMNEFTGKFTGSIADGAPENGTFSADDWSYEGTFVTDASSDKYGMALEGTARNLVWGIADEEGVLDYGYYSGPISGSGAEGEGKLEGTQTLLSYECEFIYTGGFSGNTFHGQGNFEATYAGITVLSQEGTYENGKYAPTMAEFIKYVGKNAWTLYGSFDVEKVTTDFINAHEVLFPTDSSDNIDSELMGEYYNGKLREELDSEKKSKLYKMSGYVIQAFDLEYCYDTKAILIADNYLSSNYYVIYYTGDAEINEGSTKTFYVLPVGTCEFANTGGGTTEATVLFASYIG